MFTASGKEHAGIVDVQRREQTVQTPLASKCGATMKRPDSSLYILVYALVYNNS
jgi:hypothetical protein